MISIFFKSILVCIIYICLIELLIKYTYFYVVVMFFVYSFLVVFNNISKKYDKDYENIKNFINNQK